MEITAVLPQEVTLGDNVIFTETPVPGNCSIMHREGSGLITLRALSCTQCRARFKVFFSGNITIPEGGTPGEVSLVIALDGEGVESTRMIATPGLAGRLYNVASSIYIDVPRGCCVTVSVRNSEGPAVLVQNANLIAERVA